MKKLVQLKNKENKNLDPINLNYEKRISKNSDDIDLLKGTVLYEYLDGSIDNITLNDNIANYKYVDILFKDDQNIFNSSRLVVINGAWYSLQSIQYDQSNGQTILRGKNIQLNGMYIINGSYCAIAYTANGNALYWNNNISICKVVGYK